MNRVRTLPILLLAALLLAACTVAPADMIKRESEWQTVSGKQPAKENCDYVSNAFKLNRFNADEWFTVEIPWGPSSSPASVIPPTLWGQRIGVASYIYETVRYFMGVMSKLVFLSINATGFFFVLKLAVIIMITIWGMGVMLGITNEGSGYGLFLTLLKMAAILYFATDWGGFSEMVREVIEGFIDNFAASVGAVFSSANSWEDVCWKDPARVFTSVPGLDYEVPVLGPAVNTAMSALRTVIDAATHGLIADFAFPLPTEYPHSTYDKPGPFCIVDYTFSQFWNFKLIKVLLACLFTGFAGWMYGFVLAWAMFGYLMTMVSAMWVFLIAFIARSLLYGIAPLMIAFALFKQTRSLFDGWVQQIINFTLQPVFLFAFLGIFHKMINEMMKVTLERLDVDTALDLATTTDPDKALEKMALAKSEAQVCYMRVNPNDQVPLYWWVFSVDEGETGQLTAQGANADNPINLFAILIVALLVHIMGRLTIWTTLAASSLSQGFLSAVRVPIYGLPKGVGFSPDPERRFEK